MATANKSATKASFLPAGMGKILRWRMIELAGVSMISISLALLLAFITYSSDDASLNTAASTVKTNNLLGTMGAIISDLLLQSFGLIAALIAITLSGWGWQLVRSHKIASPWLRLSLVPVGMLFAALAFSHFNPPEQWPLRGGLGGVVGDMLHFWTIDLLIEPLPLWCYVLGFTTAAITILVYTFGYSPREWQEGAKWLWVCGRFIFHQTYKICRKLASNRPNHSEIEEDETRFSFRRVLPNLRVPIEARQPERLEPTFEKTENNQSIETEFSRKQIKSDLIAPKGRGTKRRYRYCGNWWR